MAVASPAGSSVAAVSLAPGTAGPPFVGSSIGAGVFQILDSTLRKQASVAQPAAAPGSATFGVVRRHDFPPIVTPAKDIGGTGARASPIRGPGESVRSGRGRPAPGQPRPRPARPALESPAGLARRAAGAAPLPGPTGRGGASLGRAWSQAGPVVVLGEPGAGPVVAGAPSPERATAALPRDGRGLGCPPAPAAEGAAAGSGHLPGHDRRGVGAGARPGAAGAGADGLRGQAVAGPEPHLGGGSAGLAGAAAALDGALASGAGAVRVPAGGATARGQRVVGWGAGARADRRSHWRAEVPARRTGQLDLGHRARTRELRRRRCRRSWTARR